MRWMISLALFTLAATAAPREWGLQEETVELPVASPRVWEFTSPAPAAGERVVLEWTARMPSERVGGSMFFLDVRLNGEPVGAALDRTRRRLLNKPGTVTKPPHELAWHQEDSGWRIVYAPDFEAAKVSEYGPEAYHFVVDITDLVRPDQPNRVSFERRRVIHQEPLQLRSVKVRVEPGTPVATEQAEVPMPAVDSARVEGLAERQPVIVAAGHRFPLRAEFSRTGGGFSAVGPARAGDAPWASATDGVWTADGFTVARQVHGQDQRIAVEDTITNTSDRDLGWHIRYRVSLDGLVPRRVYLGGDSDATARRSWEPSNPTGYADLGEFGLGLAYEDDVLRAQGQIEYTEDEPGLMVATERFALAAGESYTFRTALYPVVDGDYFEFINRLRQSWSVRMTIPGPIVWGFEPEQILATDEATLAAGIERQGIQWFVSGGGWTDRTKPQDPPRQIGFGLGVMEPFFADKRERFRLATEKIHRVAPDVKVMLYNHSFFNEPEPDPDRFQDSWIINGAGNRFVNGWGGAYTASGGIYPTLTNSFGPAFQEMIANQMESLGTDGIYWDDSNSPTGLSDPVTHDRWDGYTAELDPKTFEIRRKLGHLYLLSEPFKLAMYQWLKDRGATLLGNGNPISMAGNRQGFPRFMETHHSLRRACESQLYSPISYGYPNLSMDQLRDRLRLGVLHYRVSLNDDSDILKHFYPITVTDLHEGWVRGTERIVTMLSGDHGWPHEAPAARLWRYGADGQMVDVTDLPAAESFRVEVPEGGIAILERAGDGG